MKICVVTLLYGGHTQLHHRLLDSFKHIPASTRIIIIGNALVQASEKLALDFRSARNASSPHVQTELYPDNKPKYVRMRSVFQDLYQFDCDWLVWFDDDSWIDKPDWFQRTTDYINAVKHENVCYIGQPWYVHHLPGQWEFIQQSSWYTGKLPELIKERPGITFAQGAYWWLRGDVAKKLNWPDVRLSHNGGDTLLGEAIRQQGLPFHKFHYGVRVNDAPRRGTSERPAGSTIDTRR